MLTFEEAVLELRGQPEHADLLRDSYLDGDLPEGAQRFAISAEFAEVLKVVGWRAGRIVVDVGAGTGIASYAFARAGAKTVFAIEPDPSSEVGRGAIGKVCVGLNVEIVATFGESMPLGTDVADVVYARQVLHHSRDLEALVGECARVLKPGGVFIASREHVVDNDSQLSSFLEAHPIHRLAGCEGAYLLTQYQAAMVNSGFRISQSLGPWDSVINAFPAARTRGDLIRRRASLARPRLGPFAMLAAVVPGPRGMLQQRLNKEAATVPGRLYTFVATKPVK